MGTGYKRSEIMLQRMAIYLGDSTEENTRFERVRTRYHGVGVRERERELRKAKGRHTHRHTEEEAMRSITGRGTAGRRDHFIQLKKPGANKNS